MSYKDKTYCASLNCTNECGRRMSDHERDGLKLLKHQYVSYGYFCGNELFLRKDDNNDNKERSNLDLE